MTCRAQVPMGLYLLHWMLLPVVVQRTGIQADMAWLVDRGTWGLAAV